MRYRLIRKPLGLTLLALAYSLAAAQVGAAERDDSTRMSIMLSHRSVAEVRRMADPVLGDHVRLGGANQTLILKAPSDEHSNLKELIKQLDRPRQRLRISLLQRSQPLRSTDHNAEPGQSNEHRYSTRESAQGERHVIQALEGRPARFDTAVDVPVVERAIDVAHGGVTKGERVRFKRLQEGLGITVRRAGASQVLIELAAATDRATNDGDHGNRRMRIQRGRAITTVRGQPGRWLLVSANDAAVPRPASSANHYSTRKIKGGNRYLYLKVERLGKPEKP